MSVLFTQFSSALSWNAFLYFSQRLSSTLLVLFLYRSLPPSSFSLWANSLSLIYLLLLWLDLGLRKSLPRFTPAFSRAGALSSFFGRVFLFQFSVLALSAPVVYFLFPRILSLLLPAVALPPFFLPLICATFIIEGCCELLRLFYHAQFLNRPFNLLASTARLTEALVCFALLSSGRFSVSVLLLARCAGSATVICLAAIRLPSYFPSGSAATSLWPSFIKHSLLMWASNSVKSLTERNFLFPVLTALLGAPSANAFKIANDGALLFERSVFKTIGTADTALLAHVEEGERWDDAFQKLSRKVAGLCIPLFGILFFVVIESTSLLQNHNVFQLFIIITAGYLLEVLVSPFERVLEVKQRYGLLALAYMPYVITVGFLFSTVSWIGLGWFVVIMQGVRLVSSCTMALLVRRYYGFGFPWRFVGTWVAVVMGAALLLAAVVPASYGSLVRAFIVRR